MTKRRGWMLPGVGLLALSFFVVGVGRLAKVDADRPDCPGKMVCPLTGELICKDRCSAKDASRPDCPGQIICPLTGKLVCKDRCPLGNKEAETAKTVKTARTMVKKPSCCQDRG